MKMKNEENNKIGELKQITTKKKEEGIFSELNYFSTMNSLFKNQNTRVELNRLISNFAFSGMSHNNMMLDSSNYRHNMDLNANYDMAYSEASRNYEMLAAQKKSANDDSDSDNEGKYKKSRHKEKERKKKCNMLKDNYDFMMKKKYCLNVESDNDEDDYGVGSSPLRLIIEN